MTVSFTVPETAVLIPVKKCITPVWRGATSKEILDYDPELLDIHVEIVSPTPIINE